MFTTFVKFVLSIVAAIRSGLTWKELLVCCAIVVALIALLLPAMNQPHDHRRSLCRHNLKDILLALHNYHEDYGSFPPAYVADADGHPLHSWRVLLLPYLDASDVYAAYDFSEPWNGPRNRTLQDQMPPCFRCPITGTDPFTTTYVAVVDQQTCWPEAMGRMISEIKDGLGQTLLVVEMHDSRIHWMEPRDLSLEEAIRPLNTVGEPSISSAHPQGAMVGVADGSVRFLTEQTEAGQRRALLLINDDQPVGE